MAEGDNPATILLTGQNRNEQFEREEDPAAAEVLTGMLLEKNAGEVQPHSTAGAKPGTTKVAVDNRGRGMERGDSYAVGDNVHYLIASGNKVFMPVAAGQTVAEDELAVSNGDGTVRTLNTGNTGETEAAVIGEFRGDLDNSGGTEPAYVRVDLLN